jgi:hypothetical protein
MNSMDQPTYIDDYNAIVAVLNMYCAGCVHADSTLMKPAFSGQTTFFGVDASGKLSGGPIQLLFDEVDSSGFRHSPEAQTVIAKVDIAGTAASARVDMNDISGHYFTDFFHLLKVQGKWTVVGKIFHAHVTPCAHRNCD